MADTAWPGWPAWLGSRIINHAFDWTHGQPTTLPHFLAQYTVHDSGLIGVWSDPFDHDGWVIISWDTFWTQGRVPYPGPETEHWPFLVLYFPMLYHISTDAPPRDATMNILASATSRVFPAASAEWVAAALVDALEIASPAPPPAETIHHTALVGILGVTCHLLHGPDVVLFCLTDDGTPIPIPDL
jgi:hypothetical protein